MSNAHPVAGRSIPFEPKRITRATVLASIAALVAAETTAAVFSVEISVICWAVLLLTLLNLPLVLPSLAAEARAALATLALVPSLKIAAVVLPLRGIPAAYWEMFPAGVALLTVLLLRRFVNGSVELRAPGTTPRGGWAAQLAIAVAGPLIALAGAAVLWALDGTTAKPALTATTASVVVVAGLSGATLEIVFRGAVQQSLVRIFGPPAGIGLTGALYAGLFAGSGSTFLMTLAFVTGVLWGVAATATGTLSGVATSHGLFAMTWAVVY